MKEKVIQANKIDVIKEISRSYLAITYKALWKEKTYAYKCFFHPMPKIVYNSIQELTNNDFGEKYLLPKYMVETFGKKYLANFRDNLYAIDQISQEERIKYLKKFRQLISEYHEVSKRVHGDIHFGNLLLDKDKEQTFMLDFDTSFSPLTDVSECMDYFSKNAKRYLKVHPYDYNLDIYLFNLHTLSVLTNTPNIFILLYGIRLGLLKQADNPNKEKINKLCKELLLLNNRKPYSGEYIVDYI